LGTQIFFFVPRLCHVDQFTFHISLPSLKFTIFIHLFHNLNACFFVFISETCHCLGRLSTSWRRYAPYVNFTEDGKPGQIIPLVLQSMVKECCGHCRDPNQTVLDFGTNGRNESSTKNSSRKLLEEMDELTDFAFPVYGHKDQDSYKGGFGYTPVIESAGVAFIVYPEVSTTQTTMFHMLLNCLPVFILPIVTAYIAGVIIWCLVSRCLFVLIRTKRLRRNPPEVRATSGQKPCIEIIYIVAETSVRLFEISSENNHF